MITVSCVLFVQMGLSDAVQRALHISLRIVSCPKCLTWWICLAYQLTHDYGILESVATSFVCAYCALWLALMYDALATLYNYAYKTITPDTAEDSQALADEASPEAGPDAVPQMQIDDDTV